MKYLINKSSGLEQPDTVGKTVFFVKYLNKLTSIIVVLLLALAKESVYC